MKSYFQRKAVEDGFVTYYNCFTYVALRIVLVMTEVDFPPRYSARRLLGRRRARPGPALLAGGSHSTKPNPVLYLYISSHHSPSQCLLSVLHSLFSRDAFNVWLNLKDFNVKFLIPEWSAFYYHHHCNLFCTSFYHVFSVLVSF